MAAEKALTLSCRRRKLFDQNGMPILIHSDSTCNDSYIQLLQQMKVDLSEKRLKQSLQYFKSQRSGLL